ncbi:Anaphase-promoting complex subunit 1 [Ceratobasidium theobromae]|uniref:Anaphase-promoting complex subunit 1 n=1 Tax=Ceratobasidium theobromae TaxID=1582974 RepID=A0A5N5QB04_9AGAM|nr:Anaphase-promoting complex subunit 1 [Ceratobasidium theobromae]
MANNRDVSPSSVEDGIDTKECVGRTGTGTGTPLSPEEDIGSSGRLKWLNALKGWGAESKGFSLGTIGPLVNGLSFRASAGVIVGFGMVAGIPPAYLSTFGPKLGLRQMVQARYSFGYYGTIVPAILQLLVTVGYSMLNVILGGQILSVVSGGTLSWNVGILVIAYERVAWFPILVVYLVVLGTGARHLSSPGVVYDPAGTSYKSVIGFGSSIMGYIVSYSPAMSDYSHYMRPEVNGWRIFALSYLGLVPTTVSVALLGAAFASSMPSNPSWQAGYSAAGSGGLVAAVLDPLGGFGKFLTVLLGLSVIANLGMSMYCFCFSFQLVFPPLARVPRYVFSFVGIGVVVPLAIVGAKRFRETLVNFLGLVGYWCAAFVAVLVMEHVYFRQCEFSMYDIDAWNDRRKLPAGIAALGACIAAFGVVVLCMRQVWYVGVIARTTGDIGLEVGLVLTGVCSNMPRVCDDHSRSFPVPFVMTTQRHELTVQDTSLSDRSAPSLMSAGTSFASSVLSTSTLNLNIRPTPRIADNSEHDKENAVPPDITISTPDRPQLKRMVSERTVADSLRGDADSAWRASEYVAYDDADADSVSGSTDELGRALFYRPSTDPISPQPDSESGAAPTRPIRPPSLNLDAEEPTRKTVDIASVRRRSQQHSRVSSRDRLSMLLGMNTSTPRTSLQSFHSSSAMCKGKAPLVDSHLPASDWVHVTPSVGTSSAVDLGSTRPRARTVSTHSRARTISSGFSHDAPDMCRSVWEDDTEDWGKGWSRVRRWLGEEPAGESFMWIEIVVCSLALDAIADCVASSSTPAPKKRHVPRALSLASTINAFRTPSTLGAFRTPSTAHMSPLFGEGLMGNPPDTSLSTSNAKDGGAGPKSAPGSRISFHSFLTTSKRTSQSGIPEEEGASATLTVPVLHPGRASSSSLSISSDGHAAPEPESPTITAKRMRPKGGTLEVPDIPIKSSKALFAESRSSLGLELDASEQQGFVRPRSSTVPVALPSPPASPRETTLAAPVPRARAPVSRSLGSPTYGSLHGRLGSPLRSGVVGEEGWTPMSPFLSPANSSPHAPPSPSWSPVSPFLPTSATSSGGPISPPLALPLGMGMSMDGMYRNDVRPLSGLTESSYRPSISNRRDSATTGKRESDATFAGRYSFTNQPLLSRPPPRSTKTKTVRIVEGSFEARARAENFPPPLPTIILPEPATSGSGSGSRPTAAAIFALRPQSGAYLGPRMRVKRKEAIGAGFSPRGWFMIGFLLGPWCWVIGGWMIQQGPIASLDIEKSQQHSLFQARWIKRCRVASLVSAVVVFGGALVAVVWAALGAR